MKNFKQGFTLIELLVVVAIIGVLAAITLGYLSNAKREGEETAVKSNLATTRTAVETFFLNNNNTYLPTGDTASNGVCPLVYNASGVNMFYRNKDVVNSIAEAVNRGRNSSYCYNSDNTWAVAVGVTSSSSWCIDVSGAARLVNFVPASAVSGTTHLCN